MLFKLFTVFLLLSLSFCSYQYESVNTRVIEITPRIKECMRCSGLFNQKFLNSVDYLEVPLLRNLATETYLTRNQIKIVVSCAQSVGSPTPPSPGGSEFDDEMFKCVKSKAIKNQISYISFEELYANCKKNATKCWKWKSETKKLLNDCESGEEDKISIACFVKECKEECEKCRLMF